MSTTSGRNNRAFFSGFVDGFGNVGQVFEPAVKGVSVCNEIKAPVVLEVRKKANPSFYTWRGQGGKFLTKRGVRRERGSGQG